jgi:hypothetical protein
MTSPRDFFTFWRGIFNVIGREAAAYSSGKAAWKAFDIFPHSLDSVQGSGQIDKSLVILLSFSDNDNR